MKKVLIVFVALVVIIGVGGYTWYKSAYGGTEYYVQITVEGKKEQHTSDSGQKYDLWNYQLTGADKDGKEQKIDFNADHNLKKSAYLKVTYNTSKGVTEWEEVQQSAIPQKAQDKLK